MASDILVRTGSMLTDINSTRSRIHDNFFQNVRVVEEFESYFKTRTNPMFHNGLSRKGNNVLLNSARSIGPFNGWSERKSGCESEETYNLYSVEPGVG
jgi:hypothetical protein